jgi:hypothetical protein
MATRRSLIKKVSFHVDRKHVAFETDVFDLRLRRGCHLTAGQKTCASRDLVFTGLARENKYPCPPPRGSKRRGSAQRVNPTSGLLLPTRRSRARSHYYTSLFILQNPTSRGHTGTLRFSAIAECHFHQTAASSLPSRHSNRTQPRLKTRQDLVARPVDIVEIQLFPAGC